MMRRRALLTGPSASLAARALTTPARIAAGPVASGLLSSSVSTAPARAQDGLPIVRIGVLWDRSGTSAMTSGPDQVVAARLAVADFGRLSRGYPVEIVSAGFERRPDQAVGIVRDWFDKGGVAAVADIPGTVAPVMVQDLARARDRTVLNTGSFNAALTGISCSPTATHWIEDTTALTLAMTLGMAAEGVKSWFLVVPDDVTGLAFQAGATAAIESTGGHLVGFARHPGDADTFTRALTNARQSGADAIGLCATGEVLTAQIKQARALGLFERSKAVCAYAATITGIHALQADEARDLRAVTTFYWNRNDHTRSFANRFHAATEHMPDRSHAATYVAIGHFLRLVETTDTLDGGVLNTRLRREPPYFFGASGRFRADGRLVLEMGLYRVKPLDQAVTPWDYYQPVRDVPAQEAFRLMGRSKCPV